MSIIKSKLTSNNTAFFLCDIQERFRDMISYMPAVIQVANNMTRSSKILKVPLLVSEQYKKVLLGIVKEIELPPNTKVYQKLKFSMWTNELENDMKTKYSDIKNIALFGIEAHICVQQTAIELIEHGYNVHIITDGVSSCRDFDRMIAFERLKQEGAYLTTSESLLFQLMETSEHPNFKEISTIIKESRIDPGLTNKKL